MMCFLTADNGGSVTVKKMDGQSSYEGSTQHGIKSQNRGPTEGAIMFQGKLFRLIIKILHFCYLVYFFRVVLLFFSLIIVIPKTRFDFNILCL